MGAARATPALEQAQAAPRRRERAARIAEPVLAQLRDLDPGEGPEAAAGGRGHLPGLRVREPPEPTEVLARSREPLVRPAGIGASQAVAPGAGPVGPPRPPPSAPVQPAAGRVPRSPAARAATTTASRSALGGLARRRRGDRRPPERVPHRRIGGEGVVQALERLVVAPLPRVAPGEPGEVAGRRLAPGRRRA